MPRHTPPAPLHRIDSPWSDPNSFRAMPTARWVAVPGYEGLYEVSERGEFREAAHRDGNRTNPRADNLKWVTKVENHFHMRAHGTHPSGERHGNAKLTAEQASEIRSSRVRSGKLALRYGVSSQQIRDIRAGRRWNVSTPPSIAIAVFCVVYFGLQLLRGAL